MTSSGGTEAQLETQQLVPGIQDEITLGHITPKLPFKAIRVLSSVSRAWHHAIRTRQVYHARLCSNATETFVLIRHSVSHMVRVISLYSLRDNLSFELPPIPPLQRGTSMCNECVVSDGKLYVFEAQFSRATDMKDTSDEVQIMPDDMQAVFVLDLGGQWQWKQCATMQKQRRYFASAAMNGHIYTLGGWRFDHAVCESEVYDPKEDKWHFIDPMPSELFSHCGVTLGEEIFVHSGISFSPEGSVSGNHRDLQVYRPGRGDWRVVESFKRQGSETIFVAEGKLYAMADGKISVYDMDRNLWTDLHSYSFDAMDSLEYLVQRGLFSPLAVLALDDDNLLAVWKVGFRTGWIQQQTFLARCKGFGSVNGELVWEKVQCPLSLSGLPSSVVMYLIQL